MKCPNCKRELAEKTYKSGPRKAFVDYVCEVVKKGLLGRKSGCGYTTVRLASTG